MTTHPEPRQRPSKLHRSLRLGLFCLVCALPVAASFVELTQFVRDGINGVDGLDGVSAVAVSPDGVNVYAVAKVDQALTAFRRDVSADALVFLEALEDQQNGVFGLVGASDVAISPDGAHVFVTADIDDTLLAFRRDVTQETLSLTTVLQDNVGGVFGLDGASSVAVAPNGRHVFVTSAIDDALTVFARDASTDGLTLVDFEQAGGLVAGASSIAVRADGERLFVTSRDDGWVSIFSRDPSVDNVVYDLSFRSDSTMGATDIALSADAQRLYVTSAETDSLSVFRATNIPPFWELDELFIDGQDGVDGLDGASAVALSPGGNLLFVAGSVDDGVAVFRVRTNGLEYVQTVVDGVDGIDGLDGALALAVSPDALHVYVAGSEDDAIAGLRLLEVFFFDDFESGDTSAWAAAVP